MVKTRGQALVEFALIAPVVLLIIGATVDMGRGLLLYGLLSGASRDMARQASLEYYSGSNTLPPSCTALTTPCGLTSILTGAHLMDSLGATVVYLDSTATGAPPTYGTYAANGDPTQPGTITLAAGATNNIVYVFIYELDPTSGATRWSCPSCAAASGSAVRIPGHQRLVVDLKLKWQPVLARFLGIPTAIVFDSQTVGRLEF
ncbi:MAG TPA: TadE family protein [Candidatus Dormibacteraeota bacterium]